MRQFLLFVSLCLGLATTTTAGEPLTYWKIDDVKPRMRGIGQTVMKGNRIEEFTAEVLGVQKGVSPGRDMILCRLSGLSDIDHAGIIQGMSGSPIVVDGKLLGAVAFAWEFAKDPIAGVTPFEQMLEYSQHDHVAAAAARKPGPTDRSMSDFNAGGPASPEFVIAGGARTEGQMATPLAGHGFSPGSLAFLNARMSALNVSAANGGAAQEDVRLKEGNQPLQRGSAVAAGLVLGDFQLAGIGTVTEVDGDRVYAFGHPMFGLGRCQFPMMTAHIHTVYPRVSVSMKMGSPLNEVGAFDTDVSTGIAGRIGVKADLLPMEVSVAGELFAQPTTYRVRIVREPSLLPALIVSVLSSAVDTDGNLPDELTAKLKVRFELKDDQPIEMSDTFSGSGFSGERGSVALFGKTARVVSMLSNNFAAPVRIEKISVAVQIERGRHTATVENIRLRNKALQPGQTLTADVELEPWHGARQTVTLKLDLPVDMPEGIYEAFIGDSASSLRRRLSNDQALLSPINLAGLMKTLRIDVATTQNQDLYLHVALPQQGLSVQGQTLPNLPGSVRSVFSSRHDSTKPSTVKSDLIQSVSTSWVLEGRDTVKFAVLKDTGVTGNTD